MKLELTEERMEFLEKDFRRGFINFCGFQVSRIKRKGDKSIFKARDVSLYKTFPFFRHPPRGARVSPIGTEQFAECSEQPEFAAGPGGGAAVPPQPKYVHWVG